MNNQAKQWNEAYIRPHYSAFQQPEPSGWKCEMFGMGGSLVMLPKKGDVPNAFWRWMQRICFGNKWSKL